VTHFRALDNGKNILCLRGEHNFWF